MTNLIKRKMSGGCFKLLSIIAFGLILSSSFMSGQSTTRKIEKITDANFKKQVAKGLIVIKFTAPYQMAAVDKKLFEGIRGYQGCVIYEVDYSQVKKVVKKLRIRNYPSIALFHNGKKVEVWKADMDGKVAVTNKDIKKTIDNILAGDVF